MPMSFLLWHALQTSDASHGESGKRASMDRRSGETVIVFGADTPEFRRCFRIDVAWVVRAQPSPSAPPGSGAALSVGVSRSGPASSPRSFRCVGRTRSESSRQPASRYMPSRIVATLW